MIGLFDLKRSLYAKWDKDTGAKLKNNITSIDMEAFTTGKRNGGIASYYSFSNRDACINELIDLMHKEKPLENDPQEDKVL